MSKFDNAADLDELRQRQLYHLWSIGETALAKQLASMSDAEYYGSQRDLHHELPTDLWFETNQLQQL